MGHKLNIRKVFRCAGIEYLRWITDSRMIILAVLIIFNYVLAVSPLQMRAEQMNKPINVMEPFIAVGNSGVILLILPIVFLILISDFPRNDGNSMFYLYRIGRYNWLCAQLLCLLLMILWLHFTKYFRKPVIELGWSYLYFGVINIALIICSFFSIKRYKFGEE